MGLAPEEAEHGNKLKEKTKKTKGLIWVSSLEVSLADVTFTNRPTGCTVHAVLGGKLANSLWIWVRRIFRLPARASYTVPCSVLMVLHLLRTVQTKRKSTQIASVCLARLPLLLTCWFSDTLLHSRLVRKLFHLVWLRRIGSFVYISPPVVRDPSYITPTASHSYISRANCLEVSVFFSHEKIYSKFSKILINSITS